MADEQRELNKTWRKAMDRHGIHVLEMPFCNREAIPEDFTYAGQILEVRMGERSTFCRFEGLGGHAFFGKERWTTRFPDWEGYLFWALLRETRDTKASGSMSAWVREYGSFGSDRNAIEWHYACRAIRDLEDFLGEEILHEFYHITCNWDSDGL